jgi:hypothetical protein
MGAYDGGIEHLHKMSRLAQCRQRIEESFESACATHMAEMLAIQPHIVELVLGHEFRTGDAMLKGFLDRRTDGLMLGMDAGGKINNSAPSFRTEGRYA